VQCLVAVCCRVLQCAATACKVANSHPPGKYIPIYRYTYTYIYIYMIHIYGIYDIYDVYIYIYHVSKVSNTNILWRCSVLLQCLAVCCSVLQQHARSPIRIYLVYISQKSALQTFCVLQCLVAEYCGVLQCVAAVYTGTNSHPPSKSFSKLSTINICVLQCLVAVCCSVLQCVAVCCSMS